MLSYALCQVKSLYTKNVSTAFTILSKAQKIPCKHEKLIIQLTSEIKVSKQKIFFKPFQIFLSFFRHRNPHYHKNLLQAQKR